jgi:hypothetical protein
LASISNKQVYWISNDEDVNETLRNIVDDHSHMVDTDLIEKFYELYDLDDEEEVIP